MSNLTGSLGLALHEDVREGARSVICAWRQRVHADLGMRAVSGTPRTSAKIAVISDVHGAFGPLVEVLASACERGAEEVWCLGDVVGRGPYARDCVELLGHMGPRLLKVWLKGNHECAMLGLDCCPSFRIDNETKSVLDKHLEELQFVVHGAGSDAGYDRWSWLDDAIECPVPGGPLFFMVHGGAPSVIETTATRYIWNSAEAVECWMYGSERAALNELHPPMIVLAGHTHVPNVMRFDRDLPHQQSSRVFGVHQVDLGAGWLYMNVGSSGGWSRGEYGLGATYALLTVTQGSVEAEIIQVKAPVLREVEAMERLRFPTDYVRSLRRGMGRDT